MLLRSTPSTNEIENASLCPGCGTSSSSALAVCPVCQKKLAEGFHPLDAIRSSHNLHGRKLPSSNLRATERLFPEGGNAISDSAWACTVYAMVPYLGILFVPAAVAIGGFGYLNARRTSNFDVARTALNAAGASIVILVVQLILWWLLYLIPEIGL